MQRTGLSSVRKSDMAGRNYITKWYFRGQENPKSRSDDMPPGTAKIGVDKDWFTGRVLYFMESMKVGKEFVVVVIVVIPAPSQRAVAGPTPGY